MEARAESCPHRPVTTLGDAFLLGFPNEPGDDLPVFLLGQVTQRRQLLELGIARRTGPEAATLLDFLELPMTMAALRPASRSPGDQA